MVYLQHKKNMTSSAPKHSHRCVVSGCTEYGIFQITDKRKLVWMDLITHKGKWPLNEGRNYIHSPINKCPWICENHFISSGMLYNN